MSLEKELQDKFGKHKTEEVNQTIFTYIFDLLFIDRRTHP